MPSNRIPALSAPLRLVIDLTSRCNLRCRYCCFFSAPEECGRDDLPPERWTALIDEAARCGVLHVTLRGGEALLSPAFFPTVEAIVRNRMRFSMLTNGILFDGAVAEKIAATGRCDLVKISLDGDEATHDAMRGKGSHAKALAAIAAARKADLPVLVTCAVHRYNCAKLPEIIRYFSEELELPEFTFSAVMSCDSPEYCLSEEQFRAAAHLIANTENAAFAPGGMYGGVKRWRKLLSGQGECGECTLLRERLTVLADGTFVPCPLLASVELGKAGRDPLAEVWKKLCADTAIVCRVHVDEACAECRFKNLCRGVCPGVARSDLRDINHFLCLRRQLEAYGGQL